MMKLRLCSLHYGVCANIWRRPVSHYCSNSKSIISSSSIEVKPKLPLYLRPPSFSTSLSELTKWHKWAKNLASSVGSSFVHLDNGPDSTLLQRELNWLLEDLLEVQHHSRVLPLLKSDSNENADVAVALRVPLEDLYCAWRQRIEERRPFQYVVGCEHWRDLVLSVQEGVLIPRPETEIIIDLVEDVALKNNPKLAQGLWADLGTGSGAIAIATARTLATRAHGRVIATDLSPVAVAVAAFNVQRYGLQQKNNAPTNNNINKTGNNGTSNGVTKVKRTRRSVPRDSPPQRSSIYRGVTRHRWTGRYEAHLWDKNCWNESQNKKGRQVYLGAYDDEEAAAHAYDLAALKYWGQDTILNFPLSTYQKELKEMENQSREEYIGSLRRKSSGFSRGVSKYRGVARHHHNGRWEARIGRVFGNKYLYLGTYATQEEAATAYDMAAIEYRGLNAVTNFDLSRYIKWLKPNNQTNSAENNPNPNLDTTPSTITPSPPNQELNLSFFNGKNNNNNLQASNPSDQALLTQSRPANATSALGLLLQSSKFKEMMEMTSAADHCQLAPPVSDPVQCSFPEDIQTYFGCQDSSSYGDHGEDIIFGELNSFMPPMFQCDLDA